MNVSSGGTADSASVAAGGTMNVSAGVTARNASVDSGGTLNVSAGGVLLPAKSPAFGFGSALTIKDPNDRNVTATATVLSGGTVDGNTKIDGGILTLDAGAVFQPHATLTIANSGWLVLEQDTFKGTITHFGRTDTLDLTKIKFIGQDSDATTATFTQNSGASGVLQIEHGSHVIDLNLSGTYTTANFALASDGTHGTLVSFVPNASLAGHG